MSFITYYENNSNLKLLSNITDNFIISPNKLSKFGEISYLDINKIASKLSSKKLSLEWDNISTQNSFQYSLAIINSINLNNFESIRVQDFGAINYILNRTDLKIDLILETGHHNQSAIMKWVDIIGNRLNKIILSYELTKKDLIKVTNELNCKTEILTIGPILLFNSPRMLLSSFSESEEAIVNSLESSHKGFYTIQNNNGTFMFHPKHLFLDINELKSDNLRIDELRIDLRFNNWNKYLNKEDHIKLTETFLKRLQSKSNDPHLKRLYPYKTINGFFNANKTDIIFKKLKNKNIERCDEKFIGEVIESKKSKYIAIKIKNSSINNIKINDMLTFHTPLGEKIDLKVLTIKDLMLESYDNTSTFQENTVFLINYTKKISPKSTVYSYEVNE